MTGLGVDLRAWRQQYENDRRLKMVADSVTAEVMDLARQPDPEDWRSDVADIVKLTAVMAIKRLYEADAELLTLKAERDHYRKVAERALTLTPNVRPITVQDEAFRNQGPFGVIPGK